MQSAERGCSFCSLLVENLATVFQVNQSWLSKKFAPMYIQLQALRNNDMMGVEDGGMAIYKIVALVVMGGAVTNPDLPLHRLGFDHIEINVSADHGKRHTPNYKLDIPVILYE